MTVNATAFSSGHIGAVFTPIKWATFFLTRFHVVEAWLKGATLCDPCAGEGVFFFALIDEALKRGVELTDELLERLFYIEREEQFAQCFLTNFEQKYNRPFPLKNIYLCDVIIDPPSLAVDILMGNPPWANFTDLPAVYKEKLKPYFVRAHLVNNKQSLLLGSSRVDIAALVIVTAINSLLTKNGKAIFFVPLSLLLNDGAHSGFRRYFLAEKGYYSLKEVYDFDTVKIFKGVSTRFGLAVFQKSVKTEYPVPYYIFQQGEWLKRFASPLGDDTASLSVYKTVQDSVKLQTFNPIILKNEQQPRQGINTCGANEVYIFNKFPEFLPGELVYPLLTKDSFRDQKLLEQPVRYIFLPYDSKTGRPLNQYTLEKKFPDAWSYLCKVKEQLYSRRGAMINSWIKRGLWWACLGVGTYSFFPYKVIWESLGKKQFQPIIIDSFQGQPWQGNQALHCYIPCRTLLEAKQALAEFKQPFVQAYLDSIRMAGTCNWAQPGRFKNVIRYASQD